ncbi:DUF1360 domain-containing protein [Kineococcus sp. T13]|nr:DUF1360 domain-containing protein [Kineococcus vitellinus]NAZ76991.1 DUF1360 domain-containing protein [Kineococcus vitellinus]
MSDLQDLHRRLHAVQDGYQGDEERPLGGFLTLMGVYAGAVGGAGLLARARGRSLPERWSAGDVALLAVATHKATRILAKDAVTSPFRAPVTRFAGNAGDGEVMEEVRGSGLRHSVGELVTCPFCLAVWVSTGFVAGGVLAPRLTRSVAAMLTAVFGSDVLHLLYDSAKHLPERAQQG